MSRCTKENCPMVGVSDDCDLKDCLYRTEADQSKDIIYREDAINAMEQRYQDILRIFKRKVKDGEKAIALDMIGCIKSLPSADRPQGEWIDAEIPLESGGSMPIQACNLCKTFYPLAYTGGGHRFCPNCGCRMKGADDE